MRKLRKNGETTWLVAGVVLAVGVSLYLLSKKSTGVPVSHSTTPVVSSSDPTDTSLVLVNTMPDGMRFYRVTGKNGFDAVNEAGASGLSVFAVLAPASLGPISRVPLIYYSQKGSDMSSRSVLLVGASSRATDPWLTLARTRVLGTSA